MEIVRSMRNWKEEEIFARLKIQLYIAFGGMIIPSLRCVGIKWNPKQEKAELSFFHDGITDLNIREHYYVIECEATCHEEPKYFGKSIIMYIDKIVSCPFPMLLPKVDEIVYLRKEPNTLFNGVSTYVPNWIVDSIIRLKVNEALRGKVTGDLREIHLTWDESETLALITFYHNGEISKDIQHHYQDIFDIATATASQWQRDGKPVIVKLAVKGNLYPNKIESPDDVDILYSRKEPFTDKPIGDD